MWYQFTAVFQKEWKDMIRDRRTVMAGLAYAVFGPLFLGFFIHFMADIQDEQKDITLFVAGAENAPGLVQYLKNRGPNIQAIAYTKDMEKTPASIMDDLNVKNSILLVIKPTYQKSLAEFKPAKLHIFTHMGNKENMIGLRNVQAVVGAYSSQIASVRVMSRGVAPSILAPIRMEVGDLSSSGVQGKMIIELMLLYFILAPFFASMAIAIDVTAGERERQSLQVLLAQPVDSQTLMAGKWAVATAFGLIGTIITVVLGAIILTNSPLGALGVSLDLSVYNVMRIITAMIPLVAFVSITQMLVSFFAKSFKEAQTYITMLSFFPALLGMMRSLTGNEAEGMLAHLPIFMDLEVLFHLLQDGEWLLSFWSIGALITFVLSLILFVFASRRLENERLLAGE
ncbi:ABC transporter permease subunit [Temperatibacter marinus]|uniref:ABC transporter permease subunit n=1 Tax=Temperatibacter marinus TaxID=1456591 RepID=A0AA52ECD2_9PROT|nr:ABC transporter permease subunit [Temperatibacter marinus]WND02115.1 ABC transporter permease subunit [Temperatibacter marinus]